MELLIKNISLRNSRLNVQFLVSTSSKRASLSLCGHMAVRSITCSARHNAGPRLRRPVFLLRNSLCFKNVAARPPARTTPPLGADRRVSMPVSNPTQSATNLILQRDTGDPKPGCRGIRHLRQNHRSARGARDSSGCPAQTANWGLIACFQAPEASWKRSKTSAAGSKNQPRLHHWYASCRH